MGAHRLFEIVRYISIIVCVLVLCYQSHDILTQYLSGKTIVTLNMKSRSMDGIPAITVCLSRWIAMDRMAVINTEFGELYNKYRQRWNNFTNVNMKAIIKEKGINNKIKAKYLELQETLHLNMTFDQLNEVAVNADDEIFQVEVSLTIKNQNGSYQSKIIMLNMTDITESFCAHHEKKVQYLY